MIKKRKICQGLLLIVPFFLLMIYQLLNFILNLKYVDLNAKWYKCNKNDNDPKELLQSITFHSTFSLVLFLMALLRFINMIYQYKLRVWIPVLVILGMQGVVKILRLFNIALWADDNGYECQKYDFMDEVLNFT